MGWWKSMPTAYTLLSAVMTIIRYFRALVTKLMPLFAGDCVFCLIAEPFYDVTCVSVSSHS